ncbi:interferon alpha/beta receptor 2 [Numida meleagris]|uniref:interferon alpha/beta receptor 2 n=1 Tax=Numida meleagris TaxID=8996 RepID=UPI000B3D9B9B|nr:interferon alpha/beta receptor 2 [Numida meleagris]XP_021260194.1 interferon alpha/beta receptor 2 [Numida meleagris]
MCFFITMETLMGGPLRFYQLVFVSILCAACCSSLPEEILRGPRVNLRMTSNNFQHILSWQTQSGQTTEPTYYRVLYNNHSKWKIAKQCSRIAQHFCNLTDDFEVVSGEYFAFVQSFVGTEVFNSSSLRFSPLYDTFLGPPEFNISSCLHCINITIKLPSTHFRKNGKLLSLFDIYKYLDYEITLKTLDEEHKRSHRTITEEPFSTVIEELYPNRNYCVSVMVTASLNKNSIPSAWKCITTDSVAKKDYHAIAIAGAVCFSIILAVILKCMHVGGYILQKKSLPDTLVFMKRFTYLPSTFESEEISSVEIIYKEVKKKTEGSIGAVSDGDDSDESESDATSNHDYARRDIVHRAPQSSDTSHVFVQLSTSSTRDDSSGQVSQNPDDDPEVFEENEMDVEEEKDADSELLNPLSEVNCPYSLRSRSNVCFTINLKSVLLGISEETTDSSAALLSSQEDAVDWQCAHAVESKLLGDTESAQKPHHLNTSDAWQNSSSSSSESDSSDSDMDPQSGYIRR